MAGFIAPSNLQPTAVGPAPIDLVACAIAHITAGNAPWPELPAHDELTAAVIMELTPLSETWGVYKEAIKALVTLDAQGASADLRSAMEHSSELKSQCAAAVALVTLHQANPDHTDRRAALDYLASCLSAESPDMILLAEAMLELRDLSWPVDRRNDYERKLEKALARLKIQVYTDGNKMTCPDTLRAAKIIAAGGDLVTARRFLLDYHENYPPYCVQLAKALAALGEIAAAQQRLEAVLRLEPSDVEVEFAHTIYDAKISALEALGKLGQVSAIPHIVPFLDSPWRCAAAKALHRLGHPIADCIAQLRESVRAEVSAGPGGVAILEIETLGMVEDVEIVPDLVALLQQNHGIVVATAAKALQRCGYDASALTAALGDFLRRAMACNNVERVINTLVELPANADVAAILIAMLEDPKSLHVINAARVLHHWGRGMEALPALRERLRQRNTLQHGPHAESDAVNLIAAILVEHNKPGRQHAHDMAQIRHACQRGRARTFDPLRGFDNRGQRRRRGHGLHGHTVASWQEVEASGAVSNRIDWRATARLGDDRRAVGRVVERQMEATGARHTMIVIDPAIFQGVPRRLVGLVAGTIAERVLQSHDPVGLMIGHGGAYIPPSTSPNQLERLMAAMSDFVEGAQTRIGLIHTLERSALRSHLRPGTMIYAIGDLAAMDPSQLEALHHSLRARGVNWQPIAVRQEILVPQLSVQTGPGEWLADACTTRVIKAVTATHLPRMESALQHVGALVAPVSGWGDNVPVEILSALDAIEHGAAPALHLRVERSAVAVTFRHETPEPRDIATQCVKARGSAERWKGLLRDAVIYGWPTPLRYAENVLEKATRAAHASDKARKALPELHDGYSLVLSSGVVPAIGYGPDTDFLASQLAQAEALLEAHERATRTVNWFGLGKTPTETRLPSSASAQHTARAPAEPLSLTASGVADPIHSGKRGMQCSPAPRGRGRYLRAKMGTRVEGAALHPNSALSHTTLEEDATQVVHATLAKHSPIDPALLQPVGGELFSVADRRATFGTTDEHASHPLLEGTVADLRTNGTATYGAALYAELTAAPTWDELASVNPALAGRWRTLVTSIQHLAVREALAVMQRAIAEESGLKYRSYQGDHVAMALWQQFTTQAEQGTATLLDLLRLILNLRGGKCQEFAALGMTLLRRAGIPTALSSGWVANTRGTVRTIAHAWAEVVLPRPNDKWMGIPLEFSPAHLAGASIGEWLPKVSFSFPTDAPANAKVERTPDVVDAQTAKVTTTPDVQPSATPRRAVQPAPPPRPPVPKERAQHILDRMARLRATGTSLQRGQVDAAAIALDIWITNGTAAFFGDGAWTWAAYFETSLQHFITVNARPIDIDGDVRATTHFTRLVREITASVTADTRPIWDHWLIAVEQYFF